jgi:hypothetical protein
VNRSEMHWNLRLDAKLLKHLACLYSSDQMKGINSEEIAAEMLLPWRRATHRNRQMQYQELNRHDANLAPDKAPQLTGGRALRWCLRYFIDGMGARTQTSPASPRFECGKSFLTALSWLCRFL